MKIRILSYNIHKGFSLFNTKFVLHEMRNMIRQSKADIVFLQEVVGEHRHHANSLESWPKESQFEFLADSVWAHYAYGKNAVFTERHHGNAILSRFPIKKWENIDLSINRFEQRGLLHCEVIIPELGQKILHLFNVHLDLFHMSRVRQAKKILQRLKSHVDPQMPFVLAGDFNDWSGRLNVHFSELVGLSESFLKKHGDHAKSFPAFFPMLKLDRVYSRNLKILISQAFSHKPWSELSDHIPLLVEFELE